MKMWFLLALAFIGIVAGFFLLRMNSLSLFPQETNAPSPTLVTGFSPTNTPLPPTVMVFVPADWKTYSADKHDFSIRYPVDVTVSDRPEGIIFTKRGATQTDGTELFDGFMLSFRQGTYTGKDFQPAMKDEYQKVKTEPSTSEISEMKPVTVAGFNGFTFRARGLGEFDYFYLPSGDGEFLQIVTLVADPKNAGFQKTVDTMFSSLQVTD